jgi:hypothetical protein
LVHRQRTTSRKGLKSWFEICNPDCFLKVRYFPLSWT